MRTKLTLILAVVTGLSISQVAVLAQTPVGTEFTYQGLLKQSGTPVNDTADFVLHLYDAETGGDQVGPVEAVYNVPVVDGLFTVECDFGDNAFTGDARWLEIAVRSPAGSGTYTTLSPRQPLTAAPYALYALSAPGGSSPWEITGSNIYYDAGNVGVGTENPEQLLHVKELDAGVAPNAYAPLVVERDYNTYINILAPDSAESGVLFGNPTYGSAAGGVVYNSAATPDGLQFRVAGNSTEMVIQSEGNVGIGTTTPAHAIQVVSDGERAIFGDNTAASGAAYGVYGKSVSTSGRGLTGMATASSGATYGVFGRSYSTDGRAVYGNASAASGLNYGVYGQSFSSSGRGVYGLASATSGLNYGVYGKTDSPSGFAGFFMASPTSGINYGVYGQTNSPDGFAGYFAGGRNYFEGDVGIGINTPAAKLHIAGTAGVDGVMFPDGTLQTTAAVGGGGDSLWSESGSNIFYTAGNVGVGTSSPGYKLHVVDSSSTAIYGECQGEGTRGELGSESGGVFGEGLLPGSVGVYGFSTASTGNGDGVRGETESGAGNGVFGENHSGAGNAIGVRGATSSPTGFGGYFEGRGYFSGNLGIGEDQPVAKLHIGGTPDVDGIMFPDGTLQTTAAVGGGGLWTPSGSDIYYDAGNVGIGWAGGAYPLDVRSSGDTTLHAQNTSSSGGLAISAVSDTGSAIVASALGSSGGTKGVSAEVYSPSGHALFGVNEATTGNAVAVYGATSSVNGIAFRGHTVGSNGYGVYLTGGRNYFGGNVGIGTSSPSERLDVVGVVKTTGFQLPTGAATGRVLTSDASGTATWQVPSSSPWDVSGANVYYDAGNVGIGTSSPAENLHVVGDSFFDGNLSIGTGTQSRINLNSGQLLMKEADGTTTVNLTAEDSDGGALLGLRQNSGTETIVLDADHYSDYVHFGARVALNQDSGNTGLELRAAVAGGGMIQCNNSAAEKRVKLGAFDSSGGYLEMRDENNADTVRIYASGAMGGNVGGRIFLRAGGVRKLELAADYDGTGFSRVVTDVIEITGGADLSEQFYVTEQAEQVKPGMVVVIDTDHPGKLALSDTAYDRKVAGVVSGAGGVQPGMLMGQRGTTADGTHPVALTGRVYCWCDASSGAIEPGDLLTTSNVPGHAMKVTDYAQAQGAVIGKAMTPLKEGNGLVLVLVNLQ